MLEWLSRLNRALGKDAFDWRWTTLVVIASVAAAALSYALTERPFLRHRRRQSTREGD